MIIIVIKNRYVFKISVSKIKKKTNKKKLIWFFMCGLMCGLEKLGVYFK